MADSVKKGLLAKLFHTEDKVLLADANKILQEAEAMRQQMEARRSQRVAHQSEMWAMLSLTPNLEEEYKSVSEDVEILAKKQFVVERYIKELTVLKQSCEVARDCERLADIPALDQFLTPEFLQTVSIFQPPHLIFK